MNRKRTVSSSIGWLVGLVVILGGLFFFMSMTMRTGPQSVDTSVGLQLIQDDKVDQAKITDGEQKVQLTLKEPYVDPDTGKDKGKLVQFYYVAPQGPTVIDAIEQADLPGGYTSVVPQQSFLGTLLGTFIPFLLLLGALWFFMSRMNGNNRAMSFGKSRAKLVNKETPQVTFQDVAGVDEAVEEIQEIKEFLEDPSKFQAVGAKIPRGVLLYGPPGTGKTLLARAVAGEAGVPFYTISGSDFVEMFVGVGASRVRDLFDQAKANAPAIIFVDEIDAVGRHRGAGMGGGHDEREQTLNQLLVEMDGFDPKTNVILIAATNRPDILDPALLRPGRFDRQIPVDAPDMLGREQILKVHAKGKPMAPEIDLKAIARRTAGFTGADLANVLNEAALLTARTGRQLIDERTVDEAIDRVSMGPQKRTRIMNEKEKKITAYHEGGHALVAAAMRYTDPVAKVTILPRGRAGGYTHVPPAEDRNYQSRNELVDRLAYALGGRVAEEMVFHDPTTGAANDIEHATKIARAMVTELGMSERVGAVKLGEGSSGEVFMGRDFGHQRDYSEAMAATVDDEVRTLMETAHNEAWEVLIEYRDVLDVLVLRLLEKETLTTKELAEVFASVEKRPVREIWLSDQHRVIPMKPPVRTPAEIAAGEHMSPEDQAAAANDDVSLDLAEAAERGESTGSTDPIAPPAAPAAGPGESQPPREVPEQKSPFDLS